jgi:hypothetical protein
MKKMGGVIKYGINCQKRETLIKFIIITPPLPAQDAREGGREGGAFAAFISTVLASALLQNLEPSLSLSLSLLFSPLFSLCLPTPAFFFCWLYQIWKLLKSSVL